MPFTLPLSLMRGPPRMADILLDSTCFSSADFENITDFDYDDSDSAENRKPYFFFNTTMAHIYSNPARLADLERASISNNILDSRFRYCHPTFPPPKFNTALCQPVRFAEYIEAEYPSVLYPCQTHLLTLGTTKEPVRKEINATVANTLLNNAPTSVATVDWIDKVFADEVLPVAFNKACLDEISECWDKNAHKFCSFPETTEDSVQDWLNHFAHALGIKHGLILKEPEEEPAVATPSQEEALSTSPEATPAAEELTPMDERQDDSQGDGQGDSQDNSQDDSEDDSEDGSEYATESGVDSDDSDAVIVTAAVEEGGVVVDYAEDRSFSALAHKHGPTGGYRLRKPDIVLLNRNVRQYLHTNQYRPRWQHVEAIVEVSYSASRQEMIRQILEKTALMFEAQAFRRFAIGLAFRGNSKEGIEYCFVYVDRSGTCISQWESIEGYGGARLAKIIFGLTYAMPEVLGFDPTMTIDRFTGNVLKIRVKDQEFTVVKHIYSPLILFGRGTHVFIVKDDKGSVYVLKDSWILVEHGLSEIDVLQTIQDCLESDKKKKKTKAYRAMCPQFIIGEDLDDSTKDRRGMLGNIPPDRKHRRVVTGPVGDSLTSYRSRAEFIKVMLDCAQCELGFSYRGKLLIGHLRAAILA